MQSDEMQLVSLSFLFEDRIKVFAKYYIACYIRLDFVNCVRKKRNFLLTLQKL